MVEEEIDTHQRESITERVESVLNMEEKVISGEIVMNQSPVLIPGCLLRLLNHIKMKM